MQTGHPPKVDSVTGVLRHMRLVRGKTSSHFKVSKAHGKHSAMKMMAVNVVSFIAEGMQGSDAHMEGTHFQCSSSPPAVAAAMGNQHIRAQVSWNTLLWFLLRF